MRLKILIMFPLPHINLNAPVLLIHLIEHDDIFSATCSIRYEIPDISHAKIMEFESEVKQI